MKTAEEYFQSVGSVGRPGPNGKTFVVIDSKHFETPWVMWMLYFQKMGMGASVAEMKKGWKTGMTWTVPTEDPHSFDGGLNIYTDEIDNARRFLNGPSDGSPESRKKVAEGKLKTFHAAKGNIRKAQKVHDQRGDDLAEVRELILEQRRNSPAYKAEQAAAEREAVKSIMNRSGREAAV